VSEMLSYREFICISVANHSISLGNGIAKSCVKMVSAVLCNRTMYRIVEKF